MKNLKHILNGFVPCVALISMMGCAILQPSTDGLLENPSFHVLFNQEQAIPTKGTFDFDIKLFKVDYEEEEIDLHVVDKRIVRNLEAEFGRKGLNRDKSNPDLLISYAVALDAPLSGAEFNEAYADDFPISIPDLEPDQNVNYHQGVLIVDVVDAKSRVLLWRGSIMAGLSMDVTEEEKDLRGKQAVNALLDHYPKPVH